MSFTNYHALYEQTSQKVSESIKLAKAGKYKEGHLLTLIEVLLMMRNVASMLGKGEREVKVIDDYISKFRSDLQEEETAKSSHGGLADCVGE